MRKQFVAFVMFSILAAWAAPGTRAQDAKGVLSNASKAMGADGVKSVQFSGTATEFAFGQAVNVSSPWPGFVEKSYTTQSAWWRAASCAGANRRDWREYSVGSAGGPVDDTVWIPEGGRRS